MNWITNTYCSVLPAEKKERLVKEHGGCEHVEENPSLLFRISRENDSFGSEAYCMCEACSNKADAEEDEEDVVCYDCQKTVKKKNSIEWRWYDFYAPSGDEPLIICDCCRKEEKHINRIRRDREDYEEEFKDG